MRGANLSSVPLSQPTVNLVPGSHRGPDGGNLIARQGQDSALSMVLRRAGLDVIIKLDRTSFKSMPPPDVWRPPAVGVKVLTSPPWQVNTSAQTHTSDAAAYRSAALCWRDKHQFHWRLRVKYSFRFAVILRELHETRPVEAGCRAFVRILFFSSFFYITNTWRSCASRFIRVFLYLCVRNIKTTLIHSQPHACAQNKNSLDGELWRVESWEKRKPLWFITVSL